MRSVVLVLAVGCGDPVAGGVWYGRPADTSIGPVSTTGDVGVETTVDTVDQATMPLFGGGIAETTEWVAASDTDANEIVFVHTTDNTTQSLALASGAGPAAMAWTGTVDPPLLHTLLRGSGGLVVVQPVAGMTEALLRAELAVCASPRGLAWDELRQRMWVACASGELVPVSADGSKLGSIWLDSDLRDVVMSSDGRALVSRPRSAEVLVVDLDSGSVSARWHPADQVDTQQGFRHFVPRVLSRMVPSDGDDGALVLYQGHDDGVIEVEEEELPEQGTSSTYGGVEGDPCDSVVRTNVAHVDPDTGFARPTVVDIRGGYPLDLLSHAGGMPTFATAKGMYVALQDAKADMDDVCVTSTGVRSTSGPATGVIEHDGRPWVTTREPFALAPLEDLRFGPPTFERTGFGVFTDSAGGIACASCHPEGGDDGHTWIFSTGARRTQSLAGHLVSETAPFHWSGDMSSFSRLFENIGVDRMGLISLHGDEEDAVLALLDDLPAPSNDAPARDPELLAQGQALFADPDVGCATCHSTWRYSNGESADVGTGGTFQVPSLIGVGTRPPYMHDGCAATLRARFDDPECGGTAHGATSQLSSSDIDAMVAFLETL